MTRALRGRTSWWRLENACDARRQDGARVVGSESVGPLVVRGHHVVRGARAGFPCPPMEYTGPSGDPPPLSTWRQGSPCGRSGHLQGAVALDAMREGAPWPHASTPERPGKHEVEHASHRSPTVCILSRLRPGSRGTPRLRRTAASEAAACGVVYLSAADNVSRPPPSCLRGVN